MTPDNLPIIKVIESSLENINLVTTKLSDKVERSKSIPAKHRITIKEISTLCASTLSHLYTLKRELSRLPNEV